MIGVDASGKVTDAAALPLGARVRDVRTADGSIYMLTDESNGRFFRLEALAEAAAAPAITNTPK